MRHHFKKPAIYLNVYGETYYCNHPLYDRCTLYLVGDRGLAVIQQRFDPNTKRTWWDSIDPWLTDVLYLNDRFLDYFNQHSGFGPLYSTVTIRQIMWALKMKPLKKEYWETVFDHDISHELQLL